MSDNLSAYRMSQHGMLAIDSDRGGVIARPMVEDTAVSAGGAVWVCTCGQDGNMVVPT